MRWMAWQTARPARPSPSAARLHADDPELTHTARRPGTDRIANGMSEQRPRDRRPRRDPAAREVGVLIRNDHDLLHLVALIAEPHAAPHANCDRVERRSRDIHEPRRNIHVINVVAPGAQSKGPVACRFGCRMSCRPDRNPWWTMLRSRAV